MAEAFIANPAGPDQGFGFEVKATADGTITVLDRRNPFEKTYRK